MKFGCDVCGRTAELSLLLSERWRLEARRRDGTLIVRVDLSDAEQAEREYNKFLCEHPV